MYIISFMREPLREWRDVQGYNLLELLYTDLKRWNFSFQHMVQLSRLNIQLEKSKQQIHMFERSVQNNRFCFGEVAHQGKMLTDVEHFILDQWYQWIANNTDISLDLIVYLQSTPEVVYQRLQKRSRQEESTIPLEYLQQVHEAHENWLVRHIPEAPPAPVLILDANADLESMYQQFKQNQDLILGEDKLQLKC
ncbi:hypothetical protein B566_EDAN007053 [Ephemera danica]|nr:hypothetical protein B566_EDAN007053 [Ephemera danica]